MKNLLDPIKVKEKYIKWLEQEISVNKIGEYLEITSPFLDRYNDYLQVYAKLEADDEIILTDDAYIINNLQMSGVDINSNKRKQVLESFLNKYNVKLEEDALVTKSGIEDFPQNRPRSAPGRQGRGRPPGPFSPAGGRLAL